MVNRSTGPLWLVIAFLGAWVYGLSNTLDHVQSYGEDVGHIQTRLKSDIEDVSSEVEQVKSDVDDLDSRVTFVEIDR